MPHRAPAESGARLPVLPDPPAGRLSALVPAPLPHLLAELHVDDLALEAGAPFAAAARLVRAIAEAAESAGARLTFRFRPPFAQGAARQGRDNVLAVLERAGHEVGSHAHGRGLGRARDAVSACGVANRGLTPGMVQAGGRAGALLERARDLGFAWVTDHAPARAWAYAGHLPWRPGAGYRADRPALGPVVLETAADPFAWGLLRREDGRIRHAHGIGESHFHALEALLAAHAACPLPPGRRGFFGFALHEHNLCPEGSLRPDNAALDALAAFLRRHEVRTAGELAFLEREPVPLGPEALRLPGLRLARRVALRLGTAPRAAAARFEVGVGGRRLRALWIGPDRPRGALLLAHAGLAGGTRTLLAPFGLEPRAFLADGLAIVAWDRSGTGGSPAPVPPTPGRDEHVEDFRAVLRAVRGRLDPGVPVGVLSFSSGVLPPLRAGEPLAFLVDGEAPADRMSLRPPAGSGAPADPILGALSPAEDLPWAGREPARLLPALRCPYHRLQAEVDHVHGRLWQHAEVMLDAARRGACPDARCNGVDVVAPLPGHLHAHGPRIRAWILDAFEGPTPAGA